MTSLKFCQYGSLWRDKLAKPSESACSAGDLGSIPGLGRSPGKGNGNPVKYSCLENSMDRGPGRLQSIGSQRVIPNCVTNFHFHFQHNWNNLVVQMAKDLPAMWETWARSLGWEDPLEKGMATHPSILAWRIPWTEELGRLWSMRSQRARHIWVTLSLNFSHTQILELSIVTSCLYK